jgi:hypothetical protein
MTIVDTPCWIIVYDPKEKKKATSEPIQITAGNVLITNADEPKVKHDLYLADTEQKCKDKEIELGLT